MYARWRRMGGGGGGSHLSMVFVGLCVGESVGGVGLGVGCSVGSILLSVAVAVGVVRGRRPRLTSISPEESPRFVDACMLIQAMRPWIMGWGSLDVGV